MISMPARQVLAPVRPRAAAQLLRDPVLADLRVGRFKARNLHDRQIQIGLEGTGAPSMRSFIPHSKEAARLLASPAGPRFEQLLRQSLREIDLAPRVELAGISLADSYEGYNLNMTMGALEQSPRAIPVLSQRPADLKRQRAQAWITNRKEYARTTSAVYDGWINLGPSVSSQFLRAAGDGRSARSKRTALAKYVLAHELHHAVSPSTQWERRQPSHWLEEATVELLSLHPKPTAERGALSASAAAALLDRNRDEWLLNNRQRYRALISLLGLAGLDPRTGLGHSQAAELLQGVPLSQVPSRIAREIIEHNDLAPAKHERLRRLISEMDGHPERADAVREWVMSAKDDA